MPTYEVSSGGQTYQLDSPTELSDADVIKAVGMHSMESHASKAGSGELRRREGEGEISASKPVGAPIYDAEAMSREPGTTAEDMRDATLFTKPGDATKMLQEMAVTGASMAVPGIGTGITGAIKTGLASGLVGGLTRQAVGGGQGTAGERVGQVAQETGLGGTAGGILGTAGKYLPKAYQSVKGLFTGSPRTATTQAMRPFKLSPSQLEAQDARSAIQKATGIDVPVGVGEAIGTPELANDIRNIQKGAELSEEARDAIKRQVAFSATELKNSGVTENDLAKHAVAAIRAQIGDMSAPAKKAVEDAARELHPQIKKAFTEIQNEARTLIPGNSSTPTSFGGKVRGHIQGGFGDVGTAENEAWSTAVNHPNYPEVKVAPTNTQKWYSDLGEKTVQQDIPLEVVNSDILDASGRAIPKESSAATRPVTSMFPTGTGTFASAAPKLSEVQTLEQMRNFRSQVGRSMGREDPNFPGRSDYEKKKLYAAASADIEAGLEKLPDGSLKKALQRAEGITKKKFATFNNKTVDKILSDYGGEEGAGPAGIASKISSAEAPAFISELRSAAGPLRAAELDNDISGYLFNQVGSSARDAVTGEISAGKILNGINALAPEIRAQYFPNYNAVVALAKRQGALSSIDAGKIIQNLSVEDPALLKEALGPAASRNVMDKVVAAFKRSAVLQARLNGTVAGALAKLDGDGLSKVVQENPVRFMRSITDGSFSPEQAGKAIGLIEARNPALVRDLQFHYTNDLLSKADSGRLSAQHLAGDLKGESGIAKAGRAREMAEAVLGKDQTETLASILDNLASIEKAGGDISANSSMIELLARGTGAALGKAIKGSGIGVLGAANEMWAVTRSYRKMKYYLASYIMNTPELRKLAITPINRLDGPTLRKVVKGFTAYMNDKISPDSPEAEEIRELNIDVNR